MNAPKPDRRALSDALSRDQNRLRRLLGRADAAREDATAQAAFTQALAASIAARELRAQSVPVPSFDDSLPVAREAERIIELIRKHQVIVIAGETGSGKTTQLPKLCLAAGRGVAGLIGCTQPRRIAARAVARRVAQELNVELGRAVGFQVRFNESVSERSHIKFMTDGILLAEIQSDRYLSAYDTLIIDEAHERSLNIDFLLGYLKRLLPQRRDLKLIVTSATIDTARFARHFDDAPVLSVEGRGYPVEVRYRPPGERERGEMGSESFSRDDADGTGRRRRENDSDPISLDPLSSIVAAVDEITHDDRHGDVLVFLPGEREIRDAHQALERRKYRDTEVLPLYARLSARDQDRVFNPGAKRRIVLATNVAETSITVPRIRYVVDPGTARVKRYSPRAKLDRLHVEAVSQASADQRKGRCGRIAAGVCYRLYSEQDYLARPRFTDPEILRASLANVILRMLTLGLGRIEDFPFLDAPDSRAIADGWQQLQELGAVKKGSESLSPRDRRARSSSRGESDSDPFFSLTPIGRTMARLPVDVKLARMLVAAQQHGALRELTVIAAFLGIQDPRERPAEQRQAADAAHAEFSDPKSEFVGVLKLWEAYRQAHEDLTQSKLRDWCGKHFLGFLRMREWRELHRQLLMLCDELGWASHRAGEPMARAMASARPGTAGPGDPKSTQLRHGRQERALPETFSVDYVAVHRSLLAGLPTQIGQKLEKGVYEGPRGRKFQLFPGSTLAKQPPPWVMAAVLLDTQKIWGLVNARIEPDWVIAELPHLLARKHYDPHWSRAQGRVLGSEQISLFGLVLAPKRPVHYGGLYPQESREIFVRQGLVTGEVNTRAAFLARNLALLEKAREEEAKLRRAGLVADEDWQARWYLDRLPPELNSAGGLDKWFRELPPAQQRQLEWSLAELLPGEGSEADRFPKFFALGDARLALHYRFEPGAIGDGVTLELPLHLLNALDPARLSWLVPGLVADKAAALIRGLPKALRRNYVPAPDFARAFAEAWMKAGADTLAGELARFLTHATGAAVAAIDFDESALEPHLRMNLRLHRTDGKVLAESRDLAALRAAHGPEAERAFASRAGRKLAAEGLREFPRDPLPDSVPGEAGVPAYPALVDTGEASALRVFADRVQAGIEHPRGVRRLLEITLAEKFKQARKQLPVSPKIGLLYAAIESQERLRDDLVEAAFNALTEQGLDALRDREAFERRSAEVARGLFGEAMQRLQLAEEILALVAELRPQLQAPLMGWARANLDDLRGQLDGLVHPGFLRSTPADVLAQLPRYLRAMLRRLERLLRDPARDQARMLELQPFVEALAQASADDRAAEPAWRALRWDLEELRVSQFAQEQGTRGPVSIKRLAKRLEALRASDRPATGDRPAKGFSERA